MGRVMQMCERAVAQCANETHTMRCRERGDAIATFDFCIQRIKHLIKLQSERRLKTKKTQKKIRDVFLFALLDKSAHILKLTTSLKLIRTSHKRQSEFTMSHVSRDERDTQKKSPIKIKPCVTLRGLSKQWW
jgi:hypothetical protein